MIQTLKRLARELSSSGSNSADAYADTLAYFRAAKFQEQNFGRYETPAYLRRRGICRARPMNLR